MFDAPVQSELFPTDLSMRRVDPSCNMRRFYRMTVQRDLFGRACLVREWGRIGCRGQTLVEQHEDEAQAVTSLINLAIRKRRRGYGI